MTTEHEHDTRGSAAAVRPPWSRAVQRSAAASLVLAGLLNGGSQYVGHLVVGDRTFSDQIRWAGEHPTFHEVEQALLVVSSLLMPIGLLGVLHLCRYGARRLTAIAAPLVVWGMWGFSNVLAMGYVAGSVAPDALSVERGVELNDALGSDAGVVVLALLPHLVGSFFGIGLLCAAAWRSGAFPRPAVLLLLGFLLWDFLLAPIGPWEAHLLLAVAWPWMGWHLWHASDDAWTGRPAS